MIFHITAGNHTDIQVNEKNLIPEQSHRTIAKWEAALNELIINYLIVDKGYKGEIYEITDRGYQIADIFKL